MIKISQVNKEKWIKMVKVYNDDDDSDKQRTNFDQKANFKHVYHCILLDKPVKVSKPKEFSFQ